MADYNIYIHAVPGSPTSVNPTLPWSNREGGVSSQTTSQSSGGSSSGEGIGAVAAITKASRYAQNPDSIVSGAVSGIAKALPWVAAAYAAVSLAEKVVNTAIEFNELQGGDYGRSIGWKNYLQARANALQPVSASIQSYKTELMWDRENQRLRAQRDLLGDSVINSYTGRGV